MKNSVFQLQYPSIKIYDSTAVFPVHRIYCVGQNYAAHAIEMGSNPERQNPFFFSKPADAVIQESLVDYPSITSNLHHEVELVVALGSEITDSSDKSIMASIYGYAVGVDLTRRDIQQEAKQSGRPWDTSKGFDHSAPLGLLLQKDQFTLDDEAEIALSVNDKVVQKARLSHLIWKVPELIRELGAYYQLTAGDLIFTGTPAGVGKINKGDVVTATIDGLPKLEFKLN